MDNHKRPAFAKLTPAQESLLKEMEKEFGVKTGRSICLLAVSEKE